MIPPQVAVGGRTPMPRNDSVASKTIIADICIGASTSTLGSTLGKTYLRAIRTREAPTISAART